MSECEVYVVLPNGDVEIAFGLKNSWLGAMFIWGKICEKYRLYQEALLPGEIRKEGYHGGRALLDGFRQLFDLVPELPKGDRILVESTCDGAIVPKEKFPEFISALRDFSEKYPGGHQSILADEIEKLAPDIRGVCFNQTSVNDSPWMLYRGYDEETEEHATSRPINIDTDNEDNNGRELFFVQDAEEEK